MRRLGGLGILLLTLSGCGVSETTMSSRTDNRKRNGDVEIGGMTSTTPSKWIAEPPSNQFRLAQFRLPGEGADDDASVIVFQNSRGTLRENIDRWEKQFPQVDVAAKKEPLTVGRLEGGFIDIQGTYNEASGGMPANPRLPAEPKPGYRFIGVHLGKNDDIYHIKFVGPAKTVERYKADFDAWLKGFK